MIYNNISNLLENDNTITSVSYKSNNNVSLVWDYSMLTDTHSNLFYSVINTNVFQGTFSYITNADWPTTNYKIDQHTDDYSNSGSIHMITNRYNPTNIYKLTNSSRYINVNAQTYIDVPFYVESLLYNGYTYIDIPNTSMTSNNVSANTYNLTDNIHIDDYMVLEYRFNDEVLINKLSGMCYLTLRTLPIYLSYSTLYISPCTDYQLSNITSNYMTTIEVYGFDVVYNELMLMGNLIIDKNSKYYKKHIDLGYINLRPLKVSKIRLRIKMNTNYAVVRMLLYNFIPQYDTNVINQYIGNRLTEPNEVSNSVIKYNSRVSAIENILYTSSIDSNNLNIQVFDTFNYLKKFNGYGLIGSGNLSIIKYDYTSAEPDYTTVSSISLDINNNNTIDISSYNMHDKYIKLDINYNISCDTLIEAAYNNVETITINNIETHYSIPNSNMLSLMNIYSLSYKQITDNIIKHVEIKRNCNTIYLHKNATNVKIKNNGTDTLYHIQIRGINRNGTYSDKYDYAYNNVTPFIAHTNGLNVTHQPFISGSTLQVTNNTIFNMGVPEFDYYILNIIPYSTGIHLREDNNNFDISYEISYDMIHNENITFVEIGQLIANVDILEYTIEYGNI